MSDQSPYNIEFKEELPNIKEYWNLFNTTDWNQEYNFTIADLKRAMEKSWYVLSAFDAGKLIGIGRVIADGVHHALIVDMIVHPHYQGKGIGSLLLERLVIKCKEFNIRDIQLFAAADKYGFYEKHGFQRRPQNAPGMQYKHND
ncbi:MAG: GNAT family N-acetyltransferase [Bacteroidota bacterium]